VRPYRSLRTRLQVKFLIASFSLTEPTYLASNARIP
jgi:hypothetical protein